MKTKIEEVLKKTVTLKFNLKEKINFKVEIPKNKKFGDYSTNIAMVLAGKLHKKPSDIANELIDELEKSFLFKQVEIAGKGFINFHLNEAVWVNLLNEINDTENYFSLNIGNNKKILIEFVSANPTGPLHIGHGRGAVLGDVLANLLSKVNFNVTKEYYINDAGNQMNILGNSIFLRAMELLGEEINFPDDHYQGDYIKKIAESIIDEFGKTVIKKDLKFFTEYGVNAILPEIKEDLEAFGIKFDNWFSEKSLFNSGKVDLLLKNLKEKGTIYEKEGAWWIKVEDDEDRVIIKKDGSYTYLTSDIAYHKDKFDRGYNELIDIWGADHHGYISRIKSAVKSVGENPDNLKILLVQMVNLLRDKKRLPLSTRKGKFVTLREVVEEVGKDAARFIFMTRKYDAQLDFDINLAKQHSNDNPVYYVQYAHARICSILKNSADEFPEKFSHLTSGDDIKIIRKLSDFKNVLLSAATNLEPHLITYYLMELAGEFHSYYNKNKILGNNERIFLISVIKKVIAEGLNILGVNAPEKM